MQTTVDADLQRHRETWLGFCRFVKIMTGAIIILLVLMALFLL